MYAQHHDDGLILSGGYMVDPLFSPDEADLLETIQMVSLRAALHDERSPLLDKLAPDHPEGPSAWTTCGDGCCLELDDQGLTRIDAIEPWLGYLVGTLFTDHSFEGTVVMWDCGERTFSALSVEGTRVRHTPILVPTGKRARRRSNPAVGRQSLRGV
jgi:hypothetical protein